MRLLTVFIATVGLSVVMFAIIHLMALSFPPNTACYVRSTPRPATSPPHCNPIINRSRPPAARPRTPPWEVLLNDTELKHKILYVHVRKAQRRHLGNQLFNYASLFGIAWRNNRIPLWPDAITQLRTAFNIRIPIDQQNAIITVSMRINSVNYQVLPYCTSIGMRLRCRR